MKYKFVLLLLLWTIGLAAQTYFEEQTLNQNWEFKYENQWLDAIVPGSNYADLLHHGIIPDPYIGTNEDSVQWVKNQEWEYQNQFTPSKELWSQETKLLIFEGLDTYAEVFLNNKKILSANNQFRTWKVDVSSILLKENNELRIQFLPPSAIEKGKIEKQGYELPGGFRTMTRKAGFHYGWDWGATITTSGIWRNVKLEGWSALKADDLFIEQKIINSDKATLVAHFNYENKKESIYEFNVNGEIQKIKLIKGKNKISIPFEINEPQLWWPNGQGEPYLYDIKCSVKLDGNYLLNTSKKIGLRTVELITDKDELGREFYFKINGKPLFMKGANYIPQDNLQSRVTDQKYKDLLDDVIGANMNMLRVWGGGIYEEDIFYDLCDSLGILVWQDFMFACAMYPGDKVYIKNIQQEAKENVIRLRQHPSIVLWCGNNENSEGWHRWGWQDAFSRREKKKVWKAYKKIFMNVLPETVAAHTNLPYWESSPQFGRGNPKHQFEGDAHYWGVWHDAEPFEVLAEKVPRFMSEFGFQSFPKMSTIRTFAKEEDLILSSDVMNTHQKHPRGNSLINEYMARDYKVPADFEDFVYVSQILQAEGMSFGLTAQRRSQPYCMGTLYWQLNDCWPVASWSSRDYYGNWKALHYAARDVFAPLLIAVKEDSVSLEISVVSDMPEDISDTYFFRLMDFKGKPIWKKRGKINIKSNQNNIIEILDLEDFKHIDTSNVVLVMELKGQNIQQLFYFAKPKNLKLAKENIEFNIQKIEEGFQVKLSSESLMKNVYLYGIQGKYSDNYFTLLPNEKKIIIIKTQEENSNLLQIKTMNKIHEKY